MLKALVHWRKVFEADGIVCVPPAGRDAGEIRIKHWQRPIVPIKKVVDRTAASLKNRGVKDVSIGPLERLTTVEGEFGAVVSMFGRTFDGVVERTVGVAYGDESFLLFDGQVSDASLFQTFRDVIYELVYYYPQGLGNKRTRWFEYTPPKGWHALTRERIAEWYPLDYPKNWASITIHPATPLDQDPTAAKLHMLIDDDVFTQFTADAEQERTPITTDKLKGTRVKTSGSFPSSGHLNYLVAVMEDGAYRYILRLETGDAFAAENEKAFDDLVESCKALPASTPEKGGGDAMIHWVD